MKFIQVGVGGFGNVWMRELKAHPDARVVALADVSEAALEEACRAHGYPRSICHPDLAGALAAVEADALVTCTPPAFHRHDVIMALEAGLHVLSEKPMAESPDDCRAMLAAARERGRVYAVSQNYRYRPATWTMARWIREGKLGRVGQAKIDFFKGSDFGGGFRHRMNYPLILDMAIHHFDLARFITGLDAVNVTAASWNPFWSNYRGDCSSTALFEMNNGARVLYSGSWCSKGGFCDWNGDWQIECEQGTLVYKRGEIRILRTEGLYKPACEELVELEEPPALAQTQVLNEFIAAVRGGPPPATAAADNIKSMAMVFGAVEAMSSGSRVVVS